MTSKKNTLTLDLRDHYSNNGYAVIHATGDQYAGTHWDVAQVVVRMDDDEEDTPELVRFAHELVNRYNQHNELTEQRDVLLAALQEMIDISSDSQGVAGYHLNGDVADWDEFVEWHAACDAIAKAKGGSVNHFVDATEMVPDGCAVLMTLDEAIDHANEKSIGSSQCAAQHAQLAKWLTDYRAMLAAAPKHEGVAS